MKTKNKFISLKNLLFNKTTPFSLLSFIIILLSGCKKNNQNVNLPILETKKNEEPLINDNMNVSAEDLSNLIYDSNPHIIFDIPIPIKTTHLQSLNENELTYVHWYESYLKVPALINFYNKALEIEGWEIEDLSTTQEGLIIARKPNKSCAISIRPEIIEQTTEPKSKIGIFTKNSKEENSSSTLDDISK